MLSAIFISLLRMFPDPRELRSEKKNVKVFDDLLLEKQTHVNRIMSQEDTAMSIVSI